MFWDIDGTLLTTARAGIHAWEEALHAVTGVAADLTTFDTAGHPDHGIARRLLVTVAGVPEPDGALVRRLTAAYEDRLPGALPRRQGRVLPHVRGILERLEGCPDVHSMLLTGNTRRGAAAKLAHYGLARFFEDGGFSEDEGDRASIARTAVARARARGWLQPGDRVYVVGDTPHDVACGHAVDARTIGVGTGPYRPEELAACGAWRVFAELPPPDAFLALLREAETAGV